MVMEGNALIPLFKGYAVIDQKADYVLQPDSAPFSLISANHNHACISKEFSKADDFFTSVLPLFTRALSTLSLVMLSSAPEGMGLPISQPGSAFLAASRNACL